MVDIAAIFNEHQAVITKLQDLIPKINHVAARMVKAVQQGGKIFWMGNGGSAADAQHLAAELIGRFKAERRALPSISLSTDTSILTCLSNDYDYSIVFSRQLEALCQPQDVVVGLTTSGNSSNVLKGIEIAKAKGAYTVGLAGHQGGKIAGLVDDCFIVPSTNTARIQEGHILIGHTLCECVEHAFASH